MSVRPRRFLSAQDPGMVQEDMTKYRDFAIELGATDAKIIVTWPPQIGPRCFNGFQADSRRGKV
jgi:hypothetical protein